MPIVMNSADYYKEHRRLIKLLKHGTKTQLKLEATKQLKEVKKRNPLFKV